ncbi:MAG: glycosyltransferase [Planctomycetota bacterium]
MNVLFLLHQGTNSRDIFRGMIEGFRRAGHGVIVYELAPPMQIIQASPAPNRFAIQAHLTQLLRSLIDANNIELCVGMWANGLLGVTNGTKEGRPASFYEIAGVPLVMWWLDAPHWCQREVMQPLFNTPLLASDKVISLINNPATAAEMRRVMGFGEVISLPYGIDETTFSPHAETARYDLVFASGPGDPPPNEMMLRELESDAPDIEMIRRSVADRVRLKLTKHLGDRPIANALVDAQLENRHAPVLDKIESIRPSLSEESTAVLDRLLSDPARFIDNTARLRAIENWERAFTLAYLSNRLGCAVMGGADFGDWPIRAERLGNVPEAEMPRVYSRSRLALNVMRWQDDQGLNLKPFEITASGAACLCTNRAGLSDIWTPDEEIAAFDTPADALDTARRLLDGPDERARIAEAGRVRTLSSHTWARRSDQIAAAVRRVGELDRISLNVRTGATTLSA